MADGMIGAAPTGQTGTPEAAPVQQQQTAQQQAQPQVNYVTSEQLNAAVNDIKKLVQSSTDKSYNRVQKMISQLQKAGIQNPTYEQAQAMLSMQGESETQQQGEEAQPSQSAAINPEAEAWIRKYGGDPALDYWSDIYDAAMEAGVEMITRDDPEYPQYFMEGNQLKNFPKSRQFVRAFEQALAAKKERLSAAGGMQQQSVSNLASSPAMAAGGVKSNFHDPKTTDRTDLITMGLQEQRRR